MPRVPVSGHRAPGLPSRLQIELVASQQSCPFMAMQDLDGASERGLERVRQSSGRQPLRHPFSGLNPVAKSIV
jgi:hypothetical protein